MREIKVMWILNATPDSFYDGGKFEDLEKAKQHIKEMIDEWVDIIDIWWFSSRPWSELPSVSEELTRILPIVDYANTLWIPLSVDTCRSEVVEKILPYKNVKYINDISGAQDERIIDLIAERPDIAYVLMHIKGTPKTMQNNPEYENIIVDILVYFSEKLHLLKMKGIENIIIDPWFWFGKTIKDNYTLLKTLDTFKKFGYPVMAGISRKSMIYKLLDSTPESILPETSALHLIACQNGVDIIRAHDVKEAKNIIKIYEALA